MSEFSENYKNLKDQISDNDSKVTLDEVKYLSKIKPRLE